MFLTASRCTAFWVGLLLVWPAQGQRHQFKTYGREQGLGNLAVTSLLQDRTGYLWVGTHEGLYRYDGRRFRQYGSAEGLPGQSIRRLVETPGGTLWVAVRNGAAWLDGDRFRPAGMGAGADIHGRSALASDRNGRLFLGTAKGLLAGGKDGFRPLPEAGTARVSAVYVAPAGVIWFGCGTRICRLDAGRLEDFGPSNGVPDDRWDAFQADSRGHLWARSSSRLLEFVVSKGRFAAKHSDMPQSGYSGSLYLSRTGELFAPTDLGLARFDESHWSLVGSAQGLPAEAASSVMEDREGSVWIGLWGSGVARWRGFNSWAGWTKGEGLSNDSVSAIVRDRSGRLWVGTDNGLNRLEPNRQPLPVIKQDGGLGGNKVRALKAASNGILWVGSAPGGVSSIDTRTGGIRRYGASQGLANDRVNGLLLDGEGRLWVSTVGGLFRSSQAGPDTRFERASPPGTTPDEVFLRLIRDSRGRIWVGGSLGLLCWDRGTWTRYTAGQGLAENAVSHVAETSEGAFWVAYERSLGVSRLWFRQGRLEVRTFTRRDGLHSDHVLFLGVDFHKRLWVGSDSGVDVRDGERWLHYQQRDGLIWDDCNPNAFLAEPDGTVWIGTSRGLARYLAQSTTMPVPPPQVALSSILFDGRPVDSFPSHRIPFARAHFTAGLAALAFLSEGDVRFRHRLAGYDDGWVETDQPEVGYRKLPPGDYTLEAMARNSVGEWGEAAALVSFHVLPPWYMTFWFRLLAISAVLGVAWVLWQWKTRNYQLEQQRLEKAVAERTEELQRQKATVEAQKQEIESLLEKANQASRLKSEFLANMSHEIRTPMNGVLGMLALALETELTPDQRDYLTTSRASAQSLLSLLNEILDLSRIETNRLNLEDVPFSLRETVGAAVHALRSDASQKALSLAFRVNDDIPDLLQGDPHRLRQVLLNLIGNAIKFTHTGGIAITAELESFSDAGLTLRFQVSDTGIGIPPELQAAIFQPFEQADGATTRRYGGSGLGLAISKSLVELMGGQIRVESTPGQGSNFHFTVRLGVARETLPERPVEAAVPLPAAQPRRVLLAEDNEVNRRVVESLLMRRGHQVACATDGKAAVEMAGRETFDLILMDVQMPEMDGLRATAAIRESEAPAGAHVPIVAMTASAMKGDREKCLAAGMDDYLAKPVHPGCLYEMIERWCGVAQRPA